MSTIMDRVTMVCETDFPTMGYQPGEKGVTLVRVLCTLISVR